jgi:hypothetical protein
MLKAQARAEGGDYEVKRWEFGLLFVEVVLLGGAAVGFLWRLGPRFFESEPPWIGAAWQGLGLFLLGLALYPVLRIESRNAHGRTLRFSRWIVAALIGAAVGFSLSLVLQ